MINSINNYSSSCCRLNKKKRTAQVKLKKTHLKIRTVKYVLKQSRNFYIINILELSGIGFQFFTNFIFSVQNERQFQLLHFEIQLQHMQTLTNFQTLPVGTRGRFIFISEKESVVRENV